MKRPFARGLALVGIVVALVAAMQAGITVTPAGHDYGDVGLGGVVYQDFQMELPPGIAPQDTVYQLSMTTTGPDAKDFLLYTPLIDVPVVTRHVNLIQCPTGPRALVCTESVRFTPTLVGPRQATLVVADNRGNRFTVPLRGKGVEPVCTNRVVFCNYAHLYSGTFGWNYSIIGPASQTKVHVQVTVTNGVAVCNGAETITANGRAQTGAITGKGLFAVEWLEDAMYPFVYRITAACPTPDWPADPDGSAATPSQPAELGHNDMSSDKQSDPSIKPGMTLEQVVIQLNRLQGTLSYPAPETDQLNGVSGNVVVSWNIVRS